MTDAEKLSQLLGSVVDLEFRDGHVVRAKLVTVDLEVPQEVVYQVLSVSEVGPSKYDLVKPGTFAAADPSELRTFRLAS